MERKIIAPAIVKHFKKHPITNQNKLYALLGIAESFKQKDGDNSSKYINTDIAKPYLFAQHTEKEPEEENYSVAIYLSNNGKLWQEAEFESMAIYIALYSDEEKDVKAGQIFARPYTMFCSEVDHKKYPNEKQVFRFEEFNQDLENNRCCFCSEVLSVVDSYNYNGIITTKFECPHCLSRKIVTRNKQNEIVSIEHLKGPQARIVAAVPYSEKTKSAEESENVIEVRPDDFKYTENKIINADYPGNMIDYIRHNMNRCNIILVNTELETRKILHDAKLNYTIAYPHEYDIESLVKHIMRKQYVFEIEDIKNNTEAYEKYIEAADNAIKEVEGYIEEVQKDEWAIAKEEFKYDAYTHSSTSLLRMLESSKCVRRYL